MWKKNNLFFDYINLRQFNYNAILPLVPVRFITSEECHKFLTE